MHRNTKYLAEIDAYVKRHGIHSVPVYDYIHTHVIPVMRNRKRKFRKLYLGLYLDLFYTAFFHGDRTLKKGYYVLDVSPKRLLDSLQDFDDDGTPLFTMSRAALYRILRKLEAAGLLQIGKQVRHGTLVKFVRYTFWAPESVRQELEQTQTFETAHRAVWKPVYETETGQTLTWAIAPTKWLKTPRSAKRMRVQGRPNAEVRKPTPKHIVRRSERARNDTIPAKRYDPNISSVYSFSSKKSKVGENTMKRGDRIVSRGSSGLTAENEAFIARLEGLGALRHMRDKAKAKNTGTRVKLGGKSVNRYSEFRDWYEDFIKKTLDVNATIPAWPVIQKKRYLKNIFRTKKPLTEAQWKEVYTVFEGIITHWAAFRLEKARATKPLPVYPPIPFAATWWDAWKTFLLAQKAKNAMGRGNYEKWAGKTKWRKL